MMAELDAIVAWFEQESIDVEAAIQQYERGKRIIAELEKRLASARNTVKKINKSFSD